MDDQRKYIFDWSLIGDLQIGRPQLGNTTRLEVYRLALFTMRDVLEERFGTQIVDEIFYAVGNKAGKVFYDHFLVGCQGLECFVRQLADALLEMKIGILRMEKSDLENGVFILTIREDCGCSAMPVTNYVTCVYEEGFIAGVLEQFSGRSFQVKEVDCWTTGDRVCRFLAKAV